MRGMGGVDMRPATQRKTIRYDREHELKSAYDVYEAGRAPCGGASSRCSRFSSTSSSRRECAAWSRDLDLADTRRRRRRLGLVGSGGGIVNVTLAGRHTSGREMGLQLRANDMSAPEHIETQ